MKEERYISTILDVSIRWWVVRFTPRLLYPRNSLDRRLGGPQRRPERCGLERTHLPLPGIEPRRSSPQPIYIPTELSRLSGIGSSFLKMIHSETRQTASTWVYPNFRPYLLMYYCCIEGRISHPAKSSSPAVRQIASQHYVTHCRCFVYMHPTDILNGV
jgi:hypothetical protein